MTKGPTFPTTSEFTHNLRPLLDALRQRPPADADPVHAGRDDIRRELAPLAGHYPALRLGPPWWFHDSPNGMRRYFDQVIETAGLYNTAGFNDDTRAFCSIPARHDVWRRVVATGSPAWSCAARSTRPSGRDGARAGVWAGETGL